MYTWGRTKLEKYRFIIDKKEGQAHKIAPHNLTCAKPVIKKYCLCVIFAKVMFTMMEVALTTKVSYQSMTKS